MPAFMPAIPGRKWKTPAKPKPIPKTHVDSMPAGVHAAATSAIKEIEDRQPFSLTEGQREMLARNMVHGDELSPQQVADYGLQPTYRVTSDANPTGVDLPVGYLSSAPTMAEIGRQGLKDSGFEGWKDSGLQEEAQQVASLIPDRFQAISPNNQKYYAHQRPVNMLASLTGDGPAQLSLGRLAAKFSPEAEMKDAAAIYERGKDNPLEGYSGLFAGPNYAEASLASTADNSTLLGAMSNIFETGSQMNDHLVQRGMDMNPASGDGGGAAALAAEAPGHWLSGLMSGGLPDAWNYATSLQSARHHGQGMNPSLPGDTYEERMANRELAKQRSELGEVGSFQELARQRGHGPLSALGLSLLGIGRELTGDPTVLFGGLRHGVKGLADEAIGESAMSSPEVAAALGYGTDESIDDMSDEDFERLQTLKRMNQSAMMNPRQSPWLK